MALRTKEDLMSIWASPRNIVAGVDGSKYGDAAIDWAICNMIRDPEDVLHLVYAFTPLDTLVDLDELGMMYTPSKEDQEKAEKNAIAVVEKAVKRSLGEEPHLKYETHVIAGDARIGICEVAERVKADAVVVGCHGRGALSRAVLGSTSTWLSHHCERPLVIVRPDPSDKTE